MQEIKSPLRYPGGKSKAIPQMLPYLPAEFSAYREPFVGGVSLFLYLKQRMPTLPVWINDLNTELICFWRQAQEDSEALARAVRKIKQECTVGESLFREMTKQDVSLLTEFERAARFFVLNRITFSGTIEAGGYSQQSFEKRFTLSSIDRLAQLGKVLAGVRITNLDYNDLLLEPGEDTFVFLDPPYLSAVKSRLYGKGGELHTRFSHSVFAQSVRVCPHRWLITYDDSPEIRRLFAFARLYTWEFQYGMNNYKQEKAGKGQELFLVNYGVSCPPGIQPALLLDEE